MKTHSLRLAAVVLACACGAPAASADEAPKTYLLRYKFRPGEVIRWEVEHRAQIRATVSGTTETTESTAISVKVWKIESVDANGVARFMHSVEKVDMRQKFDGRQETHYNSETDGEPPAGFADAAKSVGVPLTLFTLDDTGKIINREEQLAGPAQRMQEQITIPLPVEEVAIGGTWIIPDEITVTLRSGELKKLQTRQKMTLLSVEEGVATIKIETQILTPIHNPEIEAQVVQYETFGKARFDIEAGRLLGQQIDLDRSVVGFQGGASSLKYVTRSIERLLSSELAKAPTVPRPTSPARSAAPPSRQATRK